MQRVHHALTQQRETFSEKMAGKSRHEQWLELKRLQQRERAIQKAKDALMQKWATTSAVVAPLLSMRSLFQLCRQKLPLLWRVKYCARVIMKTYRQYRNWKETKRVLAEVRCLLTSRRRPAALHALFRKTYAREFAGDSF